MLCLAMLSGLPLWLLGCATPGGTLAGGAAIEGGHRCPVGYRTSGAYCVPLSSSSPAAIARVGSCPVGYRTSGNYCVALGKETKAAVVKYGSCPVGYRTSGGYCIKL